MLGWKITVWNEPKEWTWDRRTLSTGEEIWRAPNLDNAAAVLGWSTSLGGLDIFEHPDCVLLARNGGYPEVYRAPAWLFSGKEFSPPGILPRSEPIWLGKLTAETCLVTAWDQS